MDERTQHIDNTRRYVGWVYPELKWFTLEEAREAEQKRNRLLQDLSGKQVDSLGQLTKIFTGPLSRGCACCTEGTWSCLMINSTCTANCFFCPQDRERKREFVPIAGGITFADPDDYMDYLDLYNFKGVAFSGGEPTLAFDDIIVLIEKIRLRFGERMYLWMYTNGDNMDTAMLQKLKGAGLDEIRFNIVHRNYDLQPLKAALKIFDLVTVEVPAIPEDIKTLKARLHQMAIIGVRHLNLHQLQATRHNYKNFMQRNYTFLHYPSNYPVPIFESEMAALELVKYAVDKKISLPVHYCSQAYKFQFQNAGSRRRYAMQSMDSFEVVTEAGYIRQLTLSRASINLEQIIATFREAGVEDGLWRLENTREALSFHPSLLRHFQHISYDLSIRYFEVNSGGQELSHSDTGDNAAFAEKKLVSFTKWPIRGEQIHRYFNQTSGKVCSTPFEAKMDSVLSRWERIRGGPPAIF